MAKKSKKPTDAPAMSFRQRLRKNADLKLTIMLTELGRAAQEVVDETSVSEIDLMKLASGTQTSTLREGLVTQLSNDKELELEAIYNTQQGLELGDGDADEEKS
jgi:hypothetical protein